MRPIHRDPHGFHTYVSADPTVHVQGTDLPTAVDDGTVDAITSAVSAVSRTPVDLLERRGPARSLLLRCLRAMSPQTPAALARVLGLHRSSLSRVSDAWTHDVRVVARTVDDPRFPALQSHDLRFQPGWSRYRSRP
jgi:hypothetical protein